MVRFKGPVNPNRGKASFRTIASVLPGKYWTGSNDRD